MRCSRQCCFSQRQVLVWFLILTKIVNHLFIFIYHVTRYSYITFVFILNYHKKNIHNKFKKNKVTVFHVQFPRVLSSPIKTRVHSSGLITSRIIMRLRLRLRNIKVHLGRWVLYLTFVLMSHCIEIMFMKTIFILSSNHNNFKLIINWLLLNIIERTN